MGTGKIRQGKSMEFRLPQTNLFAKKNNSGNTFCSFERYGMHGWNSFMNNFLPVECNNMEYIKFSLHLPECLNANSERENDNYIVLASRV